MRVFDTKTACRRSTGQSTAAPRERAATAPTATNPAKNILNWNPCRVRDRQVRRELDRAIVVRDAIPFLAPEILLLDRSKDPA